MKEPDFSFIKNLNLQKNLETDFKELLKLKLAETPKAMALMCASIIEALLYHELEKKGFNEEELLKFSFGVMISEATKQNIIKENAKSIYYQVKDYRNIIHTGLAVKSGLKVQREEAEVCISLVKVILRDLYPEHYQSLAGMLSKLILIDSPLSVEHQLNEIILHQDKVQKEQHKHYNEQYKIAMENGIDYLSGIVYEEMGEWEDSRDKNGKISDEETLRKLKFKTSKEETIEKVRHEEALNSFNKAISVNPHAPDAYGFRGELYMHKNDYYRAIQDFNQAISLDPHGGDLGEFYGCRGSCYEKLGQYDLAIQDFNSVLDYGLYDPVFHYWIAEIHEKAGRFKEAIELYKKFTEETGQDDSFRSLELQHAQKRIAALEGEGW
ncbi:MAG: tetratricopeptide repeat protein [Firmicutes bacterium]|nr:tetratricopeptide repeat protein [Bacillota bacterium]